MNNPELPSRDTQVCIEAGTASSATKPPEASLARLAELGRLAGLIAHDLNNLLGGVLGQASLGLKDLPQGHPAAVKLKSIESAARRASGLSAQVLAYAGDQQLQNENLNLNDLVTEMTVLLEAAIARNATLTFSAAPNLHAICAVPIRIRQVILNLIINAAEAVEPGVGEILVTTSNVQLGEAELNQMVNRNACQPGNYVTLQVTDNGCGIKQGNTLRIFEPSFTTKEHGHGFGLATIIEAVHQHGGAIAVSSKPGGPTTFSVFLPATTAKVARSAQTSPPLNNGKCTGTILIADDEETILLVAQQAIEDAGFETLTASDGDIAVKLFNENSDKIVAALLDISMPRMSGIRALAEMRKINPSLQVILSSGFSRQEAAKHHEIDDNAKFLQKPYMPDKLVATIQSCLVK